MAGTQHFDKEFILRRVFRLGQDKKVHQNESEGSHTSKSALGVGPDWSSTSGCPASSLFWSSWAPYMPR